MQISSKHNIFTVTKLNKSVKELLQCHFLHVWVKGEVSNLVKATSGHWYFKLKDDRAQVQCAMFKGANRHVSFNLKNGDEVLIKAAVGLYEPRGDYQLIAEHLESSGEGQLKQAYEKLKYKLAAEGLFADQTKRALPQHVSKVGVVTSPTGAAVHDILTVLKRRAPNIEVIIYPTVVQGDSAASAIIDAIEYANVRQEVDLLIVGRGGGSIEDLWCFNDEQLAYTLFNSDLPTVSAVGHEIDTTIADYVADVRAPTPSAAAELISHNAVDLQYTFQQNKKRLFSAINHVLETRKSQLQRMQLVLHQCDPKYTLMAKQQQFDEYQHRLVTAINTLTTLLASRLHKTEKKLNAQSPVHRIKSLTQQHHRLSDRLNNAIKDTLLAKQHQLKLHAAKLNAYSPLATLARGYSISLNEQNNVIHSIKHVHIDQSLSVKVSDGVIKCHVTDTTTQ